MRIETIPWVSFIGKYRQKLCLIGTFESPLKKAFKFICYISVPHKSPGAKELERKRCCNDHIYLDNQFIGYGSPTDRL